MEGGVNGREGVCNVHGVVASCVQTSEPVVWAVAQQLYVRSSQQCCCVRYAAHQGKHSVLKQGHKPVGNRGGHGTRPANVVRACCCRQQSRRCRRAASQAANQSNAYV